MSSITIEMEGQGQLVRPVPPFPGLVQAKLSSFLIQLSHRPCWNLPVEIWAPNTKSALRVPVTFPLKSELDIGDNRY